MSTIHVIFFWRPPLGHLRDCRCQSLNIFQGHELTSPCSIVHQMDGIFLTGILYQGCFQNTEIHLTGPAKWQTPHPSVAGPPSSLKSDLGRFTYWSWIATRCDHSTGNKICWMTPIKRGVLKTNHPMFPRKFTSHLLQSLWPLGMSWFWRSRLDPLTFAISNLAQIAGSSATSWAKTQLYRILTLFFQYLAVIMAHLLTSQGRARVLCQLLTICQVWMVISEQPLKLADSTR